MSFTKWSTKNPGAKSPATMRGARFDNAQLAAAPLDTDARTDSTSRPARVRVEERLAHRRRCCRRRAPGWSAWCVAPRPPVPGARPSLPMRSSSGRARANASTSPPTMIDSVPLRAPTSPPDTGASSAATPTSRRALGDLHRERGPAGRHVDEQGAGRERAEHAVGRARPPRPRAGSRPSRTRRRSRRRPRRGSRPTSAPARPARRPSPGSGW